MFVPTGFEGWRGGSGDSDKIGGGCGRGGLWMLLVLVVRDDVMNLWVVLEDWVKNGWF